MDAVHSLILLSVMPALDLEAKGLARAAEAAGGPHSLRASVAARLADLAIRSSSTAMPTELPTPRPRR